jgi:UDP-4-amino-4-deoxy-L-arabinose-oxoglutarate aminotransferase
MKVEFFKHNLGKEEKESLNKVLNSRFITTGPTTKNFEEVFAKYLRMKYCVGVSSWTSGNLITLKALGIGQGDEVITTPMSFIATSNTIIHAGATPVFVDVEAITGNIDVKLIERAITPKTKAIIPVHLYGQMCDMISISVIAKKHNLIIIEDCAHCIEGMRDGIRPGQLSSAALFSFYATKNITSGEGGAIVTNNSDLYENLIKYRLHGMSAGAADRYSSRYQHWDMEILGYKCNMSDIQAALLIPQLRRIGDLQKKRQEIYEKYETEIASLENVAYPRILPDTKHAYHLFTIWVEPSKRDDIIFHLQKSNIGVTVNYKAIHLLSYYKNTFGLKRGMLPNAEKIGDSTITLPLYPGLFYSELDYVIDQLSRFYN